MKHLSLFTVIWIFLLFIPSSDIFAQAQWTNFVSDFKTPKMVCGDEFVWFASYAGLTRINRTTGESTIFNAGNSVMEGNRVTMLKLSPSNVPYFTVNYQLLKVENGFVQQINDEWNGMKIRVYAFNGLDFNEQGDLFATIEPDTSNIHNTHHKKIARLDANETWTVLLDADDMPPTGLNTTFAVKDTNDIYFNLSNSGISHVSRIQDGVITTFNTNNSPLPNRAASRIMNTPDGRTLFLFHHDINDVNSFETFIYDGENWETFLINDANLIGHIYFINVFFDYNDDFWITLSTGENFKYNGEIVELVTNPPMPGINSPTNGKLLNISDDGHWWLHRDNHNANRLYEYDHQTYQQHQTSNANYYSQYISDVHVNDNGDVWVTNGGTVAKYDGFTWTNYAESMADMSLKVRRTRFDSNGVMWLGLVTESSNGNILAHFNGDEWEYINLALSEDKNIEYFLDFKFDSNGVLWGAYTDGMARYDGETWTFFEDFDFNFYDNNGYQRLYITSQNEVYFASYNGLHWFNGIEFEEINLPYFNPQVEYVFWIQEDHNQNIWISTFYELFIYDGVNVIDIADSLPVGNYGLTGMVQDRNGIYWFATCNGLLRYDQNTWEFRNGGEIDNCIYDIAIDSFNNIWTTHDSEGIILYNEYGINRLPPIERCLQGTTFLDYNENGENDNIEPNLPNQKVRLLPDSTLYFSSVIGQYKIPTVINNIKTVEFLLDTSTFHLTTDSTSYTVETTNECIENLDFGIAANDIVLDGEIQIIAGVPRCDIASVFWGRVSNTGNIPFSGTYSFEMDELVEVLDVSPQPDEIINNTYYWNIEDFTPFQVHNFEFKVQFPDFQFLGDTINFKGYIFNESNQLLDSMLIEQVILCSYDPNDKSAQSTGESFEEYSLLEDALEYLIRFENKGNDTAFSVVVVDTLSPHLDIHSFEMLGSSHPVEVKIDNRVVQFTFYPIFLPYTDIDPVGSQGFIKYRIRPNSNLSDYTEINNTAYIYFDFNPAIITNTTQNILVEELPTVNTTFQRNKTNNCLFNFAPNPFEHQTKTAIPTEYTNGFFQVFDARGQVVFSEKLINQNELYFNKNRLSSGIYFYKMENEVESCVGKFLIR